MKILNVGSMNVDHVYEVDHFVRPGETLRGSSYRTFAGGKGFNQSIALARAGATTHHLGAIGKDGEWLLERLTREGVDAAHVKIAKDASGHAIIQVIPGGENAIVLHGGANLALSALDIDDAIASFSEGDYLLIQNETNGVGHAIRRGRERGLRVVFNPAPMTPAVLDYPLECVDVFVINETEAEGLTGKTSPENVRRVMRERFPGAATVLTMGSRGATFFDAEDEYHRAAIAVNAVDTTAAGDTFIGYFLAELLRSDDPQLALRSGCHAAALCVAKPGAADSIPLQMDLRTH